MRIGLLGGAFDPPHHGHLLVAAAVRRARNLDRVDLLVSGQSPHAQAKHNHADVTQRLAMARLAAGTQPGLGVQDLETRRPGKSYSIDTIRELRTRQPRDEFFFIVGGDMVADLPRWRSIGLLLKLVRFVPVLRPGFTMDVFEPLRAPLGDAAVDSLQRELVAMPPTEISSTAIRAAAGQGRPWRHWVPAPVADYIEAEGLYCQ
ncbi:MAG: nicotinate (nicotinamide) nucleotide adenylyltransferase [Planctomycetes bacterium]|nr:nicotinate (nicotinamide) nucleotide adenylyltransferase [Planctomycetota bacterium]